MVNFSKFFWNMEIVFMIKQSKTEKKKRKRKKTSIPENLRVTIVSGNDDI